MIHINKYYSRSLYHVRLELWRKFYVYKVLHMLSLVGYQNLHFIVAIVQSLSPLWLFGTPRTAACQASLSFTISWSLPKLMSIESVMPSSHPSFIIPFSCFQPFPASGSFLMSRLFASGGQSIEASASVSVLSMNIWFPLGLTGLIAPVWKHQFFNTQPPLWSNSHIHSWLLEQSQLWLYGPLLAK